MRLLLIVNLAGKAAAIFAASGTPLTALALWFAPDLLLGWHLFVPGAEGLVRMPQRFATSRPEVWLTIDDGPDPEDTPRILELLAAQGAQATFFVIGENAARHPELIRAIADAGHEVAHHTHTHPHSSFWCASPAQVQREIDEGMNALQAAGVRPTRFRPPVGIKSLWLARALRLRGLACIGWSARALERRSLTPEIAAERVTRRLAPGAILLMHEGPWVPAVIRVAAIQRVLEQLHAQHYRCIVPQPSQLDS